MKLKQLLNERFLGIGNSSTKSHLQEKRTLTKMDIDRMIHSAMPTLDNNTVKELEVAVIKAIKPIIEKHGYEIF